MSHHANDYFIDYMQDVYEEQGRILKQLNEIIERKKYGQRIEKDLSGQPKS